MNPWPPDLLVPSPLEIIDLPILREKKVTCYVKRDDLIHPLLSGNKFRKLKYNLTNLSEKNIQTLITFGGAFSNHLHATAAAGKMWGIQTVGIVRGEPSSLSNLTLSFCQQQGMILHFVSREEYRKKENSLSVQKILNQYNDFLLLPEGGANSFAKKGVAEIWNELEKQMPNSPDYLFCPSGTGATAAGLLYSRPESTKIMAFSALKSSHLKHEIINLADGINQQDLLFFDTYHFGGYARRPLSLINFVHDFKANTGIDLDYIYNGKAMFGFLDLVSQDFFPEDSSVVWLHTGGLQGNAGFR